MCLVYFKCYILFKRIKALMLFSYVLVAVLCALMAEILMEGQCDVAFRVSAQTLQLCA